MKTIGFGILAIFAIVGMCVVGIASWGYFESGSSTFATYKELEAPGLIERGWFPDCLPRSATDIEESHDVSSNSARASFKFNAGDTASIRGACKLLLESAAGTKYICPPFERQTSILILRPDNTALFESNESEI